MKTPKTSEARTIAASTDEGRERRARELEELAQKRLMRARYAEEYRRRLVSVATPVSNNKEEKEKEKKEEEPSFDNIEETKNADEPTATVSELVPDEDAEGKTVDAAEELPSVEQNSEFCEEESTERETLNSEVQQENDSEKILIRKHYSGYSDGKISLPGASFVITHTAASQVLRIDPPAANARYSAVALAGGEGISQRRFVVVPTEQSVKETGGAFTASAAFSGEVDFSSEEPVSYAAAVDADFEADASYTERANTVEREIEHYNAPHYDYSAEPENKHYEEPRYDYRAEPAAEHYNAPHYDYSAEPENKHYEEPRYDYRAEPSAEHYNAPHYDYSAEPENKHYEEPRYDYRAEPGTDNYDASYYDYSAELGRNRYDGTEEELHYTSLEKEKHEYYNGANVRYGADEEYLRFLKENGDYDREMRKKRQFSNVKSSDENKSDVGAGIAAAIQKSAHTVKKRMLYLIGRREHNLKMREYTFGVYDAQNEKALRYEEKAILKMKRKIKRAVSEDKKAIMRYYSVLSDGAGEVGCKKPQKLQSVKRRLEQLLHERDDINGRLCELYASSSFAEPSRADKKATRIKLKYTRMLYKSQKKHARRLEGLHAPVDLKKKIYDLMNKKTEACSDIEETKYLLKRKDPSGAVRRELKSKIKSARQTLRYINADIKYFYKKAEKHHERHIDDIIHAAWVVGALFAAVAGIIIWQNFEAVKAWALGILGR